MHNRQIFERFAHHALAMRAADLAQLGQFGKVILDQEPGHGQSLAARDVTTP